MTADRADVSAPGPGPWPAPSSVTRDLAERLLARAPELGVRLRDTLLAKDDVYASTELVSPEELLRSCQHNVLRTLQSLSGRVPEGADLLDAARRTARGRADVGLPLESLLHAYRLGTEVIWAALLEEARTHAPHVLDELLDSAAQVMQLIDVMSLTAANEYRDRQLEARTRDAERRQAVLDSLLDGHGGDPGVAAEAMRVLDLPKHPRLAVVVVRHETPLTSPPRSPRDALAAHGFPSEWRLRADREIGLVVLGAAPPERLARRLRSVVSGTAAVSSDVVGLSEVVTALRLAELTLDSLPIDHGDVVTLDERLPEALLVASPQVADRLREVAFGELLELETEKQDVLLATLECWFRHGRSAAEVGTELHCHRNTVLHRLNRIETLSGRKLSGSRDELLFRLALLVR